MEKTITEHYQELPVNLKKIIRIHANSSISFNTNKGVLVRLLALFLSMVSLFFLCLILFLGEGAQVVSFFVVVPITIILLNYSNRIVVDQKNGCFLRVARLLWCPVKHIQQSKIKDTEVVMTKAVNNDGLRVHLMGQVLRFDNPSDAHAFFAFLKQQFDANVLEQITDWPNKKPWMPTEDNELLHNKSPALLSEHVVPVWSLQDKLKLLVPALVFSIIAGLVQLGELL